jgi:hypothetical protein
MEISPLLPFCRVIGMSAKRTSQNTLHNLLPHEAYPGKGPHNIHIPAANVRGDTYSVYTRRKDAGQDLVE